MMLLITILMSLNPIYLKCGDEEYKWNDYREQINERLSKLNIPEDKLLGPYFVSKKCIER